MSDETTRKMQRGCTLVLELTVVNPDADGNPDPTSPRDITDALFCFSAKNEPDDDDADALFQSRDFSIADQTTSTGKVTLKVAADLTADVDIFPDDMGPIYHDIKIQEADGDVFILEKGPLEIGYDVTRKVGP